MSDIDESRVPEPTATTAGALLRQARQAQGIHVAALASAIKVVPRKLEALEADRFDELPDATFTRALAQAVCRALKIDPAPVLALLPPPNSHRLERVAEGLKTPFHADPGRLDVGQSAGIASPALWIAGLLLVGAVAMFVLPSAWLPFGRPASGGDAPTGTATTSETIVAPDAAVDPATATPPVAEPARPEASPASAAPGTAADATPQVTLPAAATEAPAASQAPVAAEARAATPPAGGALRLHATAPSWIEVVDAKGQVLLSRVVATGEDVAVDGTPPWKLKIGNAAATRVELRGQPVALAASTRDNVARLQLE